MKDALFYNSTNDQIKSNVQIQLSQKWLALQEFINSKSIESKHAVYSKN